MLAEIEAMVLALWLPGLLALPLFNPASQMVAPYTIFIVGFVAFFASLCAAVGWALYRCANRLAVLLSHSERQRWAREPKQSMALTAQPYHAWARSSAKQLGRVGDKDGWSDFI